LGEQGADSEEPNAPGQPAAQPVEQGAGSEEPEAPTATEPMVREVSSDTSMPDVPDDPVPARPAVQELAKKQMATAAVAAPPVLLPPTTNEVPQKEPEASAAAAAADTSSTLEVPGAPSEELPDKPTLTQSVEANTEVHAPVLLEQRSEEPIEQAKEELSSTEVKVLEGAADKPADAIAHVEDYVEPAATQVPEDQMTAMEQQPPTESLLSEPAAEPNPAPVVPVMPEEVPADHAALVATVGSGLADAEMQQQQQQSGKGDGQAIEVCLLGFGGASGLPAPAMVSGVNKLFSAQGLRASWAESSESVAENTVVIVSAGVPVGTDVMDRAPALKLVATSALSTDFDGIDVPACKARGIGVVRLPKSDTDSTAEVIISLVLSQLRQLAPCHRMMCDGLWAAPVQEEMQAKTVGLIGVGPLGMRLAKLFKAFRVKQILGYSPAINSQAFSAKDSVICKASLSDIFIDSDIICVCISLTPQTKSLISEQLLGLLRPDSLLVNTSRGVVDETALSKMLVEGRFRAALDLSCTDPLEESSALRSVPAEQLLLTPPAGEQNCPEVRSAMALQNFVAFLAEHPVVTCSDKEWFE